MAHYYERELMRVTKKKIAIIVIVCICIVVSSFLTWYFLYRPTVRIENVHFERSNGNVSLIFTIVNEEGGNRKVKYSYSCDDPKAGKSIAVGEGVVDLPSNGHVDVNDTPENVGAPYNIEEAKFLVVSIKITENNKIVGEYRARLSVPET